MQLPDAGHAFGSGLARTPEGKIVQGVLGSDSDAGFILRYTNRGRPDRTFGDSGVASLRFGTGTADPRDVLVGGRGTIFLAGSGKSRGSDSYGAALASLRPDGRPNRRLADDGLAMPEELERVTPLDMAFGPGGRIVVVGQLGGIPAANTVVARFRPGGSLDDSFAGDGVKVFDVTKNQLGRSVAVDGKGRIVIGSPGGAPYRHEHYIVRLLPNGRFDRSFGGNGRLEIDAVKGYEDTRDVAIDGRNRILIAGDGSARGGTVVRLLPRGRIDRTFGRRGVADMAWFGPSALAVDDSGRVFAVGSDAYAGGEVASLGRNGRSIDHAFVSGTDFLTDGFVDRRGRLVAGGNGSNGNPAVARLLRKP